MDLLTTEEVCGLLRCERRAVYRYARRGLLPAVRRRGSAALLFRRHDVEAMLEPAFAGTRPDGDQRQETINADRAMAELRAAGLKV